jgi:hypothetical protein
MGKKSRESNGASKATKPAKAPKSLVAVEAAVDPTLAALFASSVRFYSHLYSAISITNIPVGWPRTSATKKPL